MASLEIKPNMVVLAVQAVLFLFNVAVIKALFVEPFLRVFNRRNQLTVGNKQEAASLIAQATELTTRIEKRLVDVARETRADRESVRAKALDKRNIIVKAAETEARASVEAVEKRISEHLTAERAKIPQIVAQLSEDFYQRALS